MNLTELRESCLGDRVNEYSLEEVDIISPYISENFWWYINKDDMIGCRNKG